MTVIMGYKTKDRIYLGADNRTSTVDDVLIRDDANKIVVVNDNVAVAFSGYGGTQTIFENTIKNSKNIHNYRVEDVLRNLKMLYWIYKFLWHRKASKDALTYGSRFIVAGKNRKDEYCMYIMSILHGKLEKPSLTERILIPPSDASAKECVDAYAINFYAHNDFIQRTVKDVAKISKLVSSSGDIWTCDMTTSKSTSEHFS